MLHLTAPPLNFLSTGSHAKWPRISLSVSSYKGNSYLENLGGGAVKRTPLYNMLVLNLVELSENFFLAQIHAAELFSELKETSQSICHWPCHVFLSLGNEELFTRLRNLLKYHKITRSANNLLTGFDHKDKNIQYKI